jgi:predicted nucleotide-binding protein
MNENDPDKKEEIVPEQPQENTAAAPEEQKEEPSETASQEPKEKEDEDTGEAKKEIIPLEEMTFAPKEFKEGGRVCITYGRDTIMNKQVVSLIRELGIDPLVMQDKNNTTKPVAQFFTEHPDISFTIAILSADDWVYPKNGKPNDALMYADQRVIFHLGFWIGRLGRNRVFALYYDQRSFRWPTEHFDVIYTPLDKRNAWKKELVSRLTASGIKFNTDQS